MSGSVTRFDSGDRARGTLPVLEMPAARTALAIAPDEQPIGLLHLGHPQQARRVPDRAAVDEIATFLA